MRGLPPATGISRSRGVCETACGLFRFHLPGRQPGVCALLSLVRQRRHLARPRGVQCAGVGHSGRNRRPQAARVCRIAQGRSTTEILQSRSPDPSARHFIMEQPAACQSTKLGSGVGRSAGCDHPDRTVQVHFPARFIQGRQGEAAFGHCRAAGSRSATAAQEKDPGGNRARRAVQGQGRATAPLCLQGTDAVRRAAGAAESRFHGLGARDQTRHRPHRRAVSQGWRYQLRGVDLYRSRSQFSRHLGGGDQDQEIDGLFGRHMHHRQPRVRHLVGRFRRQRQLRDLFGHVIGAGVRPERAAAWRALRRASAGRHEPVSRSLPERTTPGTHPRHSVVERGCALRQSWPGASLG